MNTFVYFEILYNVPWSIWGGDTVVSSSYVYIPLVVPYYTCIVIERVVFLPTVVDVVGCRAVIARHRSLKAIVGTVGYQRSHLYDFLSYLQGDIFPQG